MRQGKSERQEECTHKEDHEWFPSLHQRISLWYLCFICIISAELCSSKVFHAGNKAGILQDTRAFSEWCVLVMVLYLIFTCITNCGLLQHSANKVCHHCPWRQGHYVQWLRSFQPQLAGRKKGFTILMWSLDIQVFIHWRYGSHLYPHRNWTLRPHSGHLWDNGDILRPRRGIFGVIVSK